jgi:F-type H+-transporting ATPase subunit gamma
MAAGKEIRGKIKSVENTKKITKAMEMVSVSKMRKAQQRMRQARPYAERVRSLAAHLSHANAEYKHPFLIRTTAPRPRRSSSSRPTRACAAASTPTSCAPSPSS